MKNLKIIIKNVPDIVYCEVWKGMAKKAAQLQGGVIEPTDSIEIDFFNERLRPQAIDVAASCIAYHCLSVSEQQRINVNDIKNKTE